jgi:murein DD-endopeptidase MepM/ murein hydrolase activator NlpD
MIRHNLPPQLQRAERRLLRIVDDYFGVRDIRGLQIALNARGARGFEGRELQTDGRLDPNTIYALFSYLQRAQDLPNERLSVSQMLTEIRAVIYLHLRAEMHDHQQEWDGIIATAATRDTGGLQTFLYAADYRDFRNNEIQNRAIVGAEELFALLSYAGGVRGYQARDIVARRPMRIASSDLDVVPSRVEQPRIAFPVQPNDGRVEWHRGSYGSHSWRSGTVHRAIDIFAPEGYAVVAPLGGRVVHIGTNPSSPGGNVVIVQAENGVMFLFSHLQTIGVSEGDTISRGQRIGTVGSTGVGLDGTAVQASHLHFEVFRGDIIRQEGRVRLRRRISYNPADLFE